MHQAFRPSRLVPPGFVVEGSACEAERTTFTIRRCSAFGICPSCGTISRRVHSRYRRRVTDLPLSGRSVRLLVVARRFRCDAVLCGRHIFAERFADGVLAPSARRTGRLDCIVHHLGLALGGRPAASFARRLILPVSKDTLLRVIRRRARVPSEALSIIGIDDWAWRRNHHYGTIVCDLERRRTVALLPDREQATAEAWLAKHPAIAIIARDRGGGYSREQFLSMTLLDIRPRKDWDALREAVAGAGSGRAERSWRHIKADGSLIDVGTYGCALTYEGRPARIVAADMRPSAIAEPPRMAAICISGTYSRETRKTRKMTGHRRGRDTSMLLLRVFTRPRPEAVIGDTRQRPAASRPRFYCPTACRSSIRISPRSSIERLPRWNPAAM